MSMFAEMKKNARLKKNMEKAKTSTPDQDYDGPDGDMIGRFARCNTGSKDGVPYAMIILKVADVPGQEDFKGQELPMLYFKFVDSEWSTVEEVQGRFFEALQKCGINTSQDDGGIEDDIKLAQKNGTLVKTAVVTKGKYRNMYLNGLAGEALGTAKYDNTKDTDGVDAVVDDADVLPSMWVGFPVTYGLSPGSELLPYIVTDADDVLFTVALKGVGDNEATELTNIPFTTLVFPD